MTSARLTSFAIAVALAACATPVELEAGTDDGSESEETGQTGDGDGDGDGDGEQGDGDGDGDGVGELGDGDGDGDPGPIDVPGSDCGPLQHVFTLDLGAELELPFGQIDAVDLTEDGGILAAQVWNNAEPPVRVHRFDAAGNYMFTIQRDWIELSNAGTRLRALPSGAFALLGPSLPQPGIVVPVVEMFDAAGASLWSWAHPMPGEGLDTRFVDIGVNGQIMSAGGNENYGTDFAWVQLFEADGMLGPQLGGAGTEGVVGEMQLGGAALAANGNVLLAGRVSNSLWVVELDQQGTIAWQTLLSPGDQSIEALMVAADGHIHVESNSKLYLLDAAGELLFINHYIVTEAGDVTGATLLGGADPVVLSSEWNGTRLVRTTPAGEELDFIVIDSITTPTAVRSDGSCRVVVGGIPAQVQVFESEP